DQLEHTPWRRKLTSRPACADSGSYTTALSIVFLAVFGVLYWLYRSRERFGAGSGLAFDPVGGIQVQNATAPATAHRAGRTYHFRSDHCRTWFEEEPDRHVGDGRATGVP